ncbi:septum formation initiator family protein [Luteimicrobium sp. NPDC057192]|uniref:FtsB family cell division protein n=1 Tax=Luteimicrobium sp. NPDC057192 TaxID=3346042 RepID=UPI003634D2B1
MVPETITTRTLVLAGAILLAFVILLPTAREYVTQSADLRALHADLAATQQQKADAQTALDRFQDPAFLKAEARLRLGYVMPGDKAYRVIDPGDANDGVSPITGKPVSAGVVEREGDAADPWYRTMWTSVQVAGTGVTTDSK